MSEPMDTAVALPTEPVSPTTTPTAPNPKRFPWASILGVLIGFGLPFAILFGMSRPNTASQAAAIPQEKKPADDEKKAPEEKKQAAPELDGGIAWLNTGGPLSLKKDLKGKIVLLDFWTLCCINCIHVMPDLTKLEKKYPNELVVIGVHSPKFENEKDTNSIRKAILRYQIEHPVINDADHKVWDRYDIDAWPTMVMIDPEGNIVGYISGEGNFDILDKVIEKVIEEHKKKKTLNEKPIRFDLARFRETGDTPLFFPGKVLADEKSKRLFIADSTHHRIVITDLDGKQIAVAGTGTPGKAEGAFDKAEFHDPQGMALNGDLLYVADRKNHTIRELDLKAKTVRTVVGTGEQEGDPNNRRLEKPVPARSIGLNSPWDLLLQGDTLFIAMAGHHQIWAYDVKKKDLVPYAGSGRENIADGPLARSNFAQPSGLATDGKNIYVADSEISALRKVPLGGVGEVKTLVGRGLFAFGDVDGPGQIDDPTKKDKEARLQHALGVAYNDGKLYIADTYNNKIKVFDLKSGELKMFLGDVGKVATPMFSEPAGISYAAGKLYVADTNAHRIRVIDIATKAITTLPLVGVTPPPIPKEAEPKK
ncbi:MAG: redoxin domain-containing protein [Planctomycetes bacterium]|nr:redoxin domain-containing protein [Planctomycetota bacterium]